MSMCERVPSQDFHGASAQQYTEKCVEELVNRKQFKAYVRHVEYSERLYLTWFIVFFGLIAVVCHHFYFFGTNYFLNPLDPASLKQLEDQAPLVDTLQYVALFMAFYLFPCAIIAPFVGFFELPTEFDSVISYGILTVLNCGIVLFGGLWCHYPPFLNTEPALSWRLSLTRNREWVEVLKYALIRAGPLQGFLTAGYLLARWRRTFWARLWHIPLPLITLPLLISIFGVLYWQFMVLMKSYILDAECLPTDVGTYLWGSAISDPQGVISLLIYMVKEVLNTMIQELQNHVLAVKLPACLRDPTSFLHLYLASFSLTLVYFIAMLLKPAFGCVINRILYFFPTHPTTWGITLLVSFASLALLLHMDEVPIYNVMGVACVIVGLFYNGFVA